MYFVVIVNTESKKEILITLVCHKQNLLGLFHSEHACQVYVWEALFTLFLLLMIALENFDSLLKSKSDVFDVSQKFHAFVTTHAGKESEMSAYKQGMTKKVWSCKPASYATYTSLIVMPFCTSTKFCNISLMLSPLKALSWDVVMKVT